MPVFRPGPTDGAAEYRATSHPGIDAGVRRQHAGLGFAIENHRRELKQDCGVERSLARSERAGQRAQRYHVGLALWASLRLEWHFDTTGVSGFEAKLRVIRDAVRAYPDRPWITPPNQQPRNSCGSQRSFFVGAFATRGRIQLIGHARK